MRLGIIGSDNSHALGFCQEANIGGRFGESVRVVGISGDDFEQAREVASAGKIAEVFRTPEELLGKVDAVIVVDRHGGKHLEHARPFLTRGIPVLVDKPLATSVSDAEAILAAAREGGAAVASYSSCRWYRDVQAVRNSIDEYGNVHAVVVSGPCDVNSIYGGHFFYGIHHVEIALTLFPGRVECLRAVRGDGAVSVVLERADGPLTTLNLLGPTKDGDSGSFPFHLSLFGTSRYLAQELTTDSDHLYEALRRFLVMLETGERPVSDEEMLESIRVLEAISSSLASDGGRVALPR